MNRKIYGFRKGLLALTVIMATAKLSSAQVGVGITNPDPSAQLQIESTSKGLLIPRVTSVSSVTAPATGLIVYQTGGTAGFYYNSGTAVTPVWLRLSDANTVASGTAGGDLTGTFPNPTIATGVITSDKILDGTITGSDIASNAAIPYSKLSLTNSVQNSDIVANAVTTSKVANFTVTTSKMADSAISGLKILTNAVNNAHIGNGVLNISKLNASTATSGQVIGFDGSNIVWTTPSGSTSGSAGGDLSGTYPNPTIANDAITTSKILDGTITGNDISASAAIPYSKLSLTNSIMNADITANSITTSKVANGTITTSKLYDSCVSGLKILTYAVGNRHIADGVLSPSKLSGAGATSGQVLSYNGSSVVWANASGGSSSPVYAFGTNSNSIIAVVLGGTDIPFPNDQNLGGVFINGSNTLFTIPTSGTYKIQYTINMTSQMLVSSRLVVNGVPMSAGNFNAITAVNAINAFAVVNLAAGDVIELQLYGLLGAVTLQGGEGAGISIQKL